VVVAKKERFVKGAGSLRPQSVYLSGGYGERKSFCKAFLVPPAAKKSSQSLPGYLGYTLGRVLGRTLRGAMARCVGDLGPVRRPIRE
jgi:hypothetical protein